MKQESIFEATNACSVSRLGCTCLACWVVMSPTRVLVPRTALMGTRSIPRIRLLMGMCLTATCSHPPAQRSCGQFQHSSHSLQHNGGQAPRLGADLQADPKVWQASATSPPTHTAM